jgi:hypothetical protein
MIEILATPNKEYFEFFCGDWLVFGIITAIVWCIKYGFDYSDNS